MECDQENPARKKQCDNVESKEMPELLGRFNLESGESFMGVRSEELFSEHRRLEDLGTVRNIRTLYQMGRYGMEKYVYSPGVKFILKK